MIPDHFRMIEPKPEPTCANCIYNHYKGKWMSIGCTKHDFPFKVKSSREMENYTCDDFQAYEDKED